MAQHDLRLLVFTHAVLNGSNLFFGLLWRWNKIFLYLGYISKCRSPPILSFTWIFPVFVQFIDRVLDPWFLILTMSFYVGNGYFVVVLLISKILWMGYLIPVQNCLDYFIIVWKLWPYWDFKLIKLHIESTLTFWFETEYINGGISLLKDIINRTTKTYNLRWCF